MQVCRYNLFARLGSMLSTSERSLVNRLSAVLELLPPALDARLVAVTGLNAFDNAVLATLAAADQETLRMTALASHTNATLPRLSRVVSRLEARGLVGRRQCPSDARATNASLTQAGADHDRRGAQGAHAARERCGAEAPREGREARKKGGNSRCPGQVRAYGQQRVAGGGDRSRA